VFSCSGCQRGALALVIDVGGCVRGVVLVVVVVYAADVAVILVGGQQAVELGTPGYSP
jgi:hypothetical protein